MTGAGTDVNNINQTYMCVYSTFPVYSMHFIVNDGALYCGCCFRISINFIFIFTIHRVSADFGRQWKRVALQRSPSEALHCKELFCNETYRNPKCKHTATMHQTNLPYHRGKLNGMPGGISRAVHIGERVSYTPQECDRIKVQTPQYETRCCFPLLLSCSVNFLISTHLVLLGCAAVVACNCKLSWCIRFSTSLFSCSVIFSRC